MADGVQDPNVTAQTTDTSMETPEKFDKGKGKAAAEQDPMDEDEDESEEDAIKRAIEMSMKGNDDQQKK